MPTREKQLTPKIYVGQAITDGADESSLLRLDLDEKLRFDERGTILPISTLTSLKSLIDLSTKYYVDYKFDDPGIIKNTSHVDFKDKSLDNVRFVKINSLPAIRERLTPKYYVDKAIFIMRMIHHC